jgi:hypothetical protein
MNSQKKIQTHFRYLAVNQPLILHHTIKKLEELDMKQWKKLLTGVLATTTVLGMTAAPAFATSYSYNAPTKSSTADPEEEESDSITGLTFTKKFTSTNGGILPDEKFSFTMVPYSPEETTLFGLDTEEGLDLTKSTVDITYNAKSESEQEATFKLDDLALEGPAVYEYEVSEVIPENADEKYAMEYDDTHYVVAVVVDNQGEISSIINIKKIETDENGEEKKSSIATDSAAAKNPIQFENKCKTDNLVIWKETAGSLASTDDYFEFYLDIPVKGATDGTGHDIQKGTTFDYSITRYDSSDTETGVITVGLPEGSTNNFSLRGGDYITIKGLPQGTIYTIQELDGDDYDTTIVGYTKELVGKSWVDKTTEEVTDDGETRDENPDTYKTYSSVEEDTPIVDGLNKVVFTNTKDKPDTGITLDVAPLLAVLLIVAAGAAVVVVSKKRIER